MSQLEGPAVKVQLHPVEWNANEFSRSFILDSNNPILLIGRASQSSGKITGAAVTNCYIDSPIISREHATFIFGSRQCPLKIIDKSSTHGTTLGVKKLMPGQETAVNNGAILTLGKQVTNGRVSHQPIMFMVNFTWVNPPSRLLAIPPGIGWRAPTPLLDYPDNSHISDEEEEVQLLSEGPVHKINLAMNATAPTSSLAAGATTDKGQSKVTTIDLTLDEPDSVDPQIVNIEEQRPHIDDDVLVASTQNSNHEESKEPSVIKETNLETGAGHWFFRYEDSDIEEEKDNTSISGPTVADYDSLYDVSVSDHSELEEDENMESEMAESFNSSDQDSVEDAIQGTYPFDSEESDEDVEEVNRVADELAAYFGMNEDEDEDDYSSDYNVDGHDTESIASEGTGSSTGSNSNVSDAKDSELTEQLQEASSSRRGHNVEDTGLPYPLPEYGFYSTPYGGINYPQYPLLVPEHDSEDGSDAESNTQEKPNTTSNGVRALSPELYYSGIIQAATQTIIQDGTRAIEDATRVIQEVVQLPEPEMPPTSPQYSPASPQHYSPASPGQYTPTSPEGYIPLSPENVIPSSPRNESPDWIPASPKWNNATEESTMPTTTTNWDITATEPITVAPIPTAIASPSTTIEPKSSAMSISNLIHTIERAEARIEKLENELASTRAPSADVNDPEHQDNTHIPWNTGVVWDWSVPDQQQAESNHGHKRSFAEFEDDNNEWHTPSTDNLEQPVLEPVSDDAAVEGMEMQEESGAVQQSSNEVESEVSPVEKSNEVQDSPPRKKIKRTGGFRSFASHCLAGVIGAAGTIGAVALVAASTPAVIEQAQLLANL